LSKRRDHKPSCDGVRESSAVTGVARGNGAFQKARIIVPVTRATIVLIEVGSCGRALWIRPKPTASVTQANASITPLRCVRRLAASSEKLFMARSPKTVPVISRGESAEGSCREPARGIIPATTRSSRATPSNKRIGTLRPRRKQAMRVAKDKTKRAAGVVKFPRLVLGRVDWLAQPMRLRWHKIVSAVRLELFQLCFFAAPV